MLDHAVDTRPSSLIGTLDDSTRDIDRIFALAGETLGHGLSVFESLTERLGVMSAELLGEDMTATREGLSAVAAELQSLGSGLAAGIAELERVGLQGDQASASVGQLMRLIQFVTAVARCGRIEEATLSAAAGAGAAGGTRGRTVFTEVGVLVGQALATIERCWRDQERFRDTLGPAIRSQRDFASRYTVPLGAAAAELTASLDQLEQCRARNVGLTSDAARQARRIGDVVGDALVALQCGDSTRQRLEHTRDTMVLARDLASSVPAGPNAPAAPNLTAPDQSALRAILTKLSAVQLMDTAAEMDRNTRQVDQALCLLSDETAALMDGPKVRDDDQQFLALLAVVKAKLAQASDLMGKCRAARAEADAATHAVTSLVRAFGEAAGSLSGLVRDMVLVGMNVGLYASRLGDEGRSLVAIARELKATADTIGEHAATLLPIYAQMQTSLAGMTAETAGGTKRLASLDGTMLASLAAMSAQGVKLGDVLATLESTGADFAAGLDDARAAFAGARTVHSSIVGTAQRQQEESAATGALLRDADGQIVIAFLEREILPRYTIAVERQLFRDVLASHGLTLSQPAAPEPELASGDASEQSWEF